MQSALRSSAMPPSTDAFTKALRKLPRPRGRQLKFLRAHYQAPGRVETATNLAEAAGYKSFDGINLQYGLLASRIGKAVGRRNANLFLLVEFAGPGHVTNDHWLLCMRPEFAQALEQVGWV